MLRSNSEFVIPFAFTQSRQPRRAAHIVVAGVQSSLVTESAVLQATSSQPGTRFGGGHAPLS